MTFSLERRSMAKAQVVRYTSKLGDSNPCHGANNWNQSHNILVIPGEQGTIYVLVRHTTNTKTVCRTRNDEKFILSPMPGDQELNILCGKQEVIGHVEVADEDVALLHAKIDMQEQLQPVEDRVTRILSDYQYAGVPHSLS